MNHFRVIPKALYNTINPWIARELRRDYFSINRVQLSKIADNYMTYGHNDKFYPEEPSGTAPTPQELLKKNRPLLDPQPFVCTLSDIQLIGVSALPLPKGTQNRFILEMIDGSSQLLTREIVKTVLDGDIPVRRDRGYHLHQPVVSLVGPWSSAYYHWFADYLPRIRGVEMYIEKSGSIPYILIEDNPPKWMIDSLHQIGVSNEHIITWTGGRLNINQCVIPSIPRYVESDKPAHGYYPSPQALRWVSNRIKSNLNISSEKTKRIFITRRKASTRGIKNEDAVIHTLAAFDFTAVDLTNMEFRDQVELFSKAEIVVAPHGAGLINTIYSQNTHILELFGDYINACYYCIAGGFNHSYRYLLCKDVSGELVVDTEILRRMINDWVLSGGE